MSVSALCSVFKTIIHTIYTEQCLIAKTPPNTIQVRLVLMFIARIKTHGTISNSLCILEPYHSFYSYRLEPYIIHKEKLKPNLI